MAGHPARPWWAQQRRLGSPESGGWKRGRPEDGETYGQRSAFSSMWTQSHRLADGEQTGLKLCRDTHLVSCMPPGGSPHPSAQRAAHLALLQQQPAVLVAEGCSSSSPLGATRRPCYSDRPPLLHGVLALVLSTALTRHPGSAVAAVCRCGRAESVRGMRTPLSLAKRTKSVYFAGSLQGPLEFCFGGRM
jgi:hypothetical protein